MNKILIGVTSFGRLPYTKKCLEALEATEHPLDCIIADNASPNPEVQEFLKQYDGKILSNGSTFKVLFLDKNYGVGKALNQILAHRKAGQHFMKLDNDTIMPSIPVTVCGINYIPEDKVNTKWLDEMLDCLENSVDQISCIGALLFDRNRETKAPAKIVTTTTGNSYVTEDFTSSHINGACQLYKNTTIDLLGKFRENFIYGYEDSVMASRANEYGLGLAAEWLYITHIDQLNLGEDTDRILEIKKKSLSGELEVPD